MLIAAFDLASSTGYAYGRPNTTPACGAVRAPVCGEDLGAFGSFYFRFFSQLLTQLHARAEPDESIVVIYEQPVLIEKHWDPVKGRLTGGNPIVTTRKLQGLGMLLETVCQLHPASIEVRECHLSSIKKELTGNGRADKSEMVRIAQLCGVQLPEGNEAKDAADAFGAFLMAVRYKADRVDRDLWDRRVARAMHRS